MDILLVDDEPLVREALLDFLEDQLGHKVTALDDGREALKLFKKTPFHMVLTDIRMPGMNGIELLQSLKDLPRGKISDIVIITGYGDINTAIQALRAGAYDYLLKPINIEELAIVVERIAEHQSLLHENVELSKRFEEKLAEATHETQDKLKRLRSAYAEIVGIGRIGVFSDRFRNVVAMAERLHEDRSVPVLIEGETGTGKEIVARLVHYGHGEVTTPFVSINCSAISSNLFESELFGYEGGAFTGAKKEGMEGKLELARGGTLFLDEIGDLPLELQPKLLRALQEREIYRVGGLKKINIDVRIICATNRNLTKLVEEGAFRRDLFFRLNMGRIFISPLREKKEEIAPLAQLFLEQFAELKNRRFRFLTKGAVKVLENHSWPGNIRELQNTIERVVLLYDDIEVRPEHLRFLTSDCDDITSIQGTPLKPGSIVLPPDSLNLEVLEAEIIRKTLAMFNGNKSRTADYLGITRSALRSRIKKAF